MDIKDRLGGLTARFHELFGKDAEPSLFFAPGRVNLIGEHTDHEGGYVFPCAIDLGIWALAAVHHGTVRLNSMNFNERTLIESVPRGVRYYEKWGWANYPLGIFHVLEKHGAPVPDGLDIVFWGNLPEGAGLSSSAAIEVLTARIITDLFGANFKPDQLALLAQEAENDFIGVKCGIMDQFAVSMGKKGHAILLDCAELDYKYVPLTLGDCKGPQARSCRIVITNSNVPHTLAEAGEGGVSPYNLRRQQCEAALADIRAVRPELKNLCDLSEEEFEDVKDAIKTPEALRRARHAVTENARAIRAVTALEGGDLATFGELMKGSHLSLRDDYQVTVPELDALAELAWAQPGVVGSRMTGGGFGGCTVSIVHEAAIEDFIRDVGAGYEKRTGRTASFYVTDTADGARKI
ncbi:MAG: galactokinase [Synergistaceae bacterium]|nr:galactokinase [Synergistaceae bacterium]